MFKAIYRLMKALKLKHEALKSEPEAFSKENQTSLA